MWTPSLDSVATFSWALIEYGKIMEICLGIIFYSSCQVNLSPTQWKWIINDDLFVFHSVACPGLAVFTHLVLFVARAFVQFQYLRMASRSGLNVNHWYSDLFEESVSSLQDVVVHKLLTQNHYRRR